MSRAVCRILIILTLCAVSPALLQAQGLGNPFNNCCQVCHVPVAQCTCAAPQPTVQTQYQPVKETHYEPQQQVTYRDVSEIQYRREAKVEKVPVTTYQTVTVDEGSYQKVWIPKLVTKQVPQTVYQQRTTYKNVPYQVTRKVPEVKTTMVPRQSVRYVPRQTVLNRPGCSTCTTPHAALPGTTLGALPAPVSTAAVPTLPALTVPTPQTAQTQSSASGNSTPQPTPDPYFQEQSANDSSTSTQSAKLKQRKTNRQASNADPRLGGYEIAPSQSSEQQRRPVRQAKSERKSKKFVPAPSAATVWQSNTSPYR